MLLRCKVLSPPCLSWVKTGKVQSEHIESALPPEASLERTCRVVALCQFRP